MATPERPGADSVAKLHVLALAHRTAKDLNILPTPSAPLLELFLSAFSDLPDLATALLPDQPRQPLFDDRPLRRPLRSNLCPVTDAALCFGPLTRVEEGGVSRDVLREWRPRCDLAFELPGLPIARLADTFRGNKATPKVVFR